MGKVAEKRVADGWQTEVSILKRERGVMPVDVQLSTVAGKTLIKRWDGREKLGLVTFETKDKPANVLLDPSDAILDNTRLNNGFIRYQFLFEYPSMRFSPRS